MRVTRVPAYSLFRLVGLLFVTPVLCAQSTTPFAGRTAVGQSTTLTVTVAVTRSGSGAAIRATNQSLANGDFTLTGGGSCVQGATYLAGQSCTATIMFAPQAPGLRQGGVSIVDGSGKPMGEVNLTGVGAGALAVLDPGNIQTVAGDGQWIYQGDGVAAVMAPIFLPDGVAVDAAGNFYLSDSSNNRVRRVDAATGTISTIAGTGASGYSGDGGPATQAMVSNPGGLTLDGLGNVYFADTGNHAIRRIDAVTGTITTVAGTAGQEGYKGDNGLATLALLAFPQAVVFDANGTMYIADTGNNTVRRVAANGVISTFAGTGAAGYNGDGIPATKAQLNSPWGLAPGNDGSLYIADRSNNRVRQVMLTGTMQTVAGTGVPGFAGDTANATAAMLQAPVAVAVDPAGNLYVADSGNNRVRKVYVADGSINTICGNDTQQFTGDAGPANKASLYGPYALALDGAGDLFIADLFHNRIREISATSVSLMYPTMRVGKTSAPMPVSLASDGNLPLGLTKLPLNNSALDTATTTCSLSGTLAPGADCVLGVEFAPTVIGNPANGTVTVDSSALVGSFGTAPVVSLSGIVLSVNPTAIALTSSQNPSVTGASVTFTATVTGGPALTGTVTFADGTATLCTAALSSGTSTCTSSTLTLGSHAITATYSGDTDDAATTSAVLTQVVKQQPVLALAVAPNPAVVGAPVTCTLTVTAPAGTPSGTVTFMDGTAAIGTATLAAGTASLLTTSLAVGTHSITAQYSGDTSNIAGTSSATSEVIHAQTSNTLLATSSANAAVGAGVTFTATVGNGTASTPSGTVQFNDGAASLGSASVNSTGVATLTVTTLAPGTHNVTAVYSGDSTNAASTSSAVIETITQITTTTGLVSSSNPISAGATLQLTATVSPSPNTNGGVLTGSVTFSDGANTLGVVAVDANGHAALNVSTLTPGTHRIVATYAGNTNFAGSVSTALQQVVQQTATSIGLVSAVNPSTAGQAVSLTVTVGSATGTPTGTVTLKEGGNSLGSATLNAGGVAVFSISTLSVGSHSLTAVYSGDASYTTNVSTTLLQVVNQGSSTAALSASANPQTQGQSVTFTATITSATANPAGSVSFLDGSTMLATVALNGSGVATYATSTLTTGHHIISVTYGGDTNHAASNTASLTESIVQASTASLISSANPATSGNSVTLTARISGSGTTIPTGTVVFSDGTTVLGSPMLDAAGMATVQVSALAVGSHILTVSYAGDTNYFSSAATLTETIQSASTQITLKASANPATYGQAVSFTATVLSNGSIATGSASFTVDGTLLGSALLNGSGTATLTTASLPPGSHSIVVNYAGDGNVSPSSSVPLPLSVLQTTAVALASSANPTQTLTGFTLTVTVTNSHAGVATGTVTFADGSTSLGMARLDATGAATLAIASLGAGTHSLTASYTGDAADFAGVSAAFTQTVTLRPTSTTLSGTPNDPNNPQSVLLIGVVNGSGTPPPGGSITFTEGSQTLGTVPVGTTGVVTLPVILATGSHLIVATYSGDSSYAASASNATSISGGAVTQFSIQLTPAAMTLQSKQHGVSTLSLTSTAGYTDTMQFGCLGLPFAATCTFNKTAATLAANGTTNVQLTVDTGNPLGAGGTAQNHRSGSNVLLCLLPAGLLLGFGLRHRKLSSLLPCLLALAMTLPAIGCAGLSVNGTPAGTYTFKVTASGQATGVTQSQTMTLTVTQ